MTVTYADIRQQHIEARKAHDTWLTDTLGALLTEIKAVAKEQQRDPLHQDIITAVNKLVKRNLGAISKTEKEIKDKGLGGDVLVKANAEKQRLLNENDEWSKFLPVQAEATEEDLRKLFVQVAINLGLEGVTPIKKHFMTSAKDYGSVFDVKVDMSLASKLADKVLSADILGLTVVEAEQKLMKEE